MRDGRSEFPYMRVKRWRVHFVMLLLYTLLALALTWPLVTRLATHVPGDGVDDPPLTWNLWWIRYALLDRQTNPFDCDYLFYPLGINLAFYTLTVINGLLALPLQATLGLIPASNILLLSSFVLSGYGAFLLAEYLMQRHWQEHAARISFASRHVYFAAFAAGLLYAFASSKLFYAALGQWNIASSQWIPYYILYLFKTGDHARRWRYPLLAALFLLLQAYAELTYATFLVLFTALWAVWHTLTHFLPVNRARVGAPALAGRSSAGSGSFFRFGMNLTLIAALFLAGLAPMLAMMIPDMLAEGDIFVEGTGFAEAYSADLLGFLVPTMHHPLFGGFVERFGFGHTVGQHLYLGYSVLALVILAVSRRRHRRDAGFWLLAAFVFWLLTLGPALRINGHDTAIPLPFALVSQLPFFSANRYPSRYSVLLVLSLAMLVAFALASLRPQAQQGAAQSALPYRSTAAARAGAWLSSARSRLLPFFLVALILIEHLSAPLPISDMRVPDLYRTIGQMEGDFTLLDVPVAWRNGFRVTGTQHPVIMFEQYYQTVHGKRILAGNTSRNPPLKFQYFTEAPVINTLIALETGHQVAPAVVERDRTLSAGVLRFFNIRAIVVHPAQAGPDVVPYVEQTMPAQRFYDDEELIAFRVDLPPYPRAWTISPDDELAKLSFAEGWGVPANDLVWAQRQEVRLLVPMDGQRQWMSFRAFAPSDEQRLRVEINGQGLGWNAMAAGWNDYTLAIPGDAVKQGLNEVVLRFRNLYPAGQAHVSSRAIGLTQWASPVNLVVQSAGKEVGDFGHIYVDGKDVSPGLRGYNVAVLHPETGAVESVATFDTHLDEAASTRLALFLKDIPLGRIVAVAASDEGSRLLSSDAVSALQGIGATGDLRGKFRWGHAIIGIQGAEPGTAQETMDWMRPVVQVAGEALTEPEVAAAFATIAFTAVSD